MKFRPYGAVQRLVRAAVFLMLMGEEIKLRVARDFRMCGEKLRQLRILAAHVPLVGQQAWIMLHHSGERGAQAQQTDQFFLRGCQVVVAHRRDKRLHRRGGL